MTAMQHHSTGFFMLGNFEYFPSADAQIHHALHTEADYGGSFDVGNPAE